MGEGSPLKVTAIFFQKYFVKTFFPPKTVKERSCDVCKTNLVTLYSQSVSNAMSQNSKIVDAHLFFMRSCLMKVRKKLRSSKNKFKRCQKDKAQPRNTKRPLKAKFLEEKQKKI